MKKLLLTISLFFIPFSAFAALTNDMTRVIPSSAISCSSMEYSVFDTGNPDFYSSAIYNTDTGDIVAIYSGNQGMICVGDEFELAAYYPNSSYPLTTLLVGNYSLITYNNSNFCESATYSACKASGDFADEALFSITSQTNLRSGVLFGRSGESQTAIQSGGGVLAAVGLVSTNAFTGVFPYLMLSVGVFLTFYVVQKIAMLWGDRMKPESAKIDPEQANWSGKGKMEHEYHEFKKKKRSRIKRGLE